MHRRLLAIALAWPVAVVVISCGGGKEGEPGNDASLASLALSAGTLTPAFDPLTTDYTVEVGHSVGTISVTPSAAHSGATIRVNGAVVTSGAVSDPISLVAGKTVITISVNSADGATSKSYTITANKLAQPSSNAKLAGLAISVGTLAPAFDANTFSYAATVACDVASFAVTPTASGPNAAITVNDTAVVSGVSSGSIALHSGANLIRVVITAEDGVQTATYSIAAQRQALCMTPAQTSVTAGNSLTMTVKLASASASDKVVTIQNSDAVNASAPASVTLFAGETQKDFIVSAINQATVMISASLDGDSVSSTLHINLPSVDDGVACTIDAYDPLAALATHTPNSAFCDDGLFCNGPETCNGTLGCLAGSAPNCDDGNACTTDACDESVAGCTHTPLNSTSGTPCYTGPGGTTNVGACHGGVAGCVNGVAACVGQVLPGIEICNGVDDNCNGVADDGIVCP